MISFRSASLFRFLFSWFAVVLALPVHADDSSAALPTVFFRGQSYFVQTLDPHKDDIRLFWGDDQGQALRDFNGLDKYVTSKGEHLLFAANAGMFEGDLRPVGLLVLGGVEKSPLNLNEAPGNFYMKPNGVFLINEKHEAMVVESGAYPTLLTPVLWATQSGPFLVHGGSIHPEFNSDSKSKKIRSGIGVSKEGNVFLALSHNPVNFYEFATLFLTKFKCPNALFLDGDISAFTIPGLRDPAAHTFGPMIGIIESPK